MPIKIHHPHDTFLRRCLTDIDVARDLLKSNLPDHIAKRIDWSTVQLTNKSFVQENLRELHSDLVYKCRLDGKELYIYLVLEHQSTPDPLLPFRVLQYNISLMEEHLAQGNKQLPLIANMCLYAGNPTPYPHSVDIYDCFEDASLSRQVMFKPMQLIDLTVVSEEELSSHGQADLVEILLKQGVMRDFLRWIERNKDLVSKLLMSRAYGESGIVYILGVDEKNDPQQLIDALIAAIPEQKSKIMTAAQQLEARGEKIGEARGRQSRNVEIAKHMLKAEMHREQVATFTGLDLKQVDKLLEELL